jgi:hypothetical protein
VTATRALCSPIAVLAIVVLVVNDHVLKAAYPGLVTGKLSDLAGMVFFPLLLAAACEQLGVRRDMILAAVVATGLAFVAVKLGPAAEAYRVGLAALQWPFRAVFALASGHAVPAVGRAQLVADPTDLVALVALAVPLALASRRHVLEDVDAPARRVGMLG